VEATGHYDDFGVSDLVNETVLVSDSPGPEPSKLVLEWLWLTQTGIRLAIDISDELRDAGMNLPILRRPPIEIFKGLRQEGDTSH
jgi:hypothetical protein